MDKIFIEQLKKYGRMTPEAEQDLLGMVHKVHKKKGEQIVRQQQVATSFYIIEKGLVRSYNVINNKENTIWFAYEGQIAVASKCRFWAMVSSCLQVRNVSNVW